MSLLYTLVGNLSRERFCFSPPRLGMVRQTARLLALALLVLGTATMPADAGFLTAPTYPAGSQPIAVAVGDFNGDGIPDLAVANNGWPGLGALSILLGNGDGTFQAPLTYGLDIEPYSITVADFNGDGLPDLLLTDLGIVSILLGNGDGTFQAAQDYTVSGYTGGSPAVGDFNGDGILDIAVPDDPDNTVNILLGKGDGTFQPPQNYAAGSTPYSAAVGDFNGDGILDLVVTNFGTGLSILLGNGDGSFQAPKSYAAADIPVAVAVGDLNGDGILDIAVANGDTSGETPGFSILLGKGDGTFQPAQHYLAPFPANSLALGDFNADGHLDIVLGLNSVVGVFLGKGEGTFQAPIFYATGLGGTSVTVADFNGDGVVDLALTDFPGVAGVDSTVSILLGKGDGTFQAARCYVPGGPSGVEAVFDSVAVADFNGDGVPDLVVVQVNALPSPSYQGPYQGNVVVLLGNGDGTFQSPQSYISGGNSSFVAVGDFNGDGIPDLVVVNTSFGFGAGTVGVLLGNGDGTFQAALTTAAGNGPNCVAVGDFNGDGKLDIVTTNFAASGDRYQTDIVENDVRVFLGNGDGTFQPAQVYAVDAPDSHPTFVAVGDVNGDGIPDLAVIEASSMLDLFLGNGDGTFQAAQSYAVGLLLSPWWWGILTATGWPISP